MSLDYLSVSVELDWFETTLYLKLFWKT
jgi:hypothetical protein